MPGHWTACFWLALIRKLAQILTAAKFCFILPPVLADTQGKDVS